MKARRSSGLRYRPYARSTSIHHSDPEVICDDDEPDDTIVVVYDRRRHQAAPAAPARGAAAGRKDGGAGAAAAASSGTLASAAPGSAPPPAGGTATKSQLEFSPWRVSRIPLPADPNTPDHSKTLCASPADAATSGHKAAAELTVDELFSPFSGSPVVRNTDTGTVKKWKRNRRKSRRGKGPVTSTPAPGAPGSQRGSTGSAPATPALRPPDVSEVRDVTPFVITLDEDPTVLEVTEVRRVVRHTTPSEKRTVRTDLSADVMLLDTSSERTPARRLRAANLSKMRPGRVGTRSPGGRVTKKSPAQPARKSPAQPARKSPAKKSPAAKGKTAAGTAAPAADLESSLEEGELTRTRHDSNDCTVVRVKPLRRTSSTQRRLQAVKKMAVRTLSRSQVKTPSRPGKSGRSHRSKRSDRPRDHRSQRNLKGPNERGPTRWMVDRRGSRFAAPLGATSDQPIKFAPDFSESFARMVSERPKRPVIIDGPNVAYAHGRNKVCSFRGIKIVLDYFKNLGHRCTVFIPSTFINRARTQENEKLLEDLYQTGELAYTPSRYIRGRLVTSYDDRYVVMYATRVGGVIISRDLYRDVAQERPDWGDTIDNRLLIPTFVGDQLLLPPDPLGRDGPGLLEFLRFPPGSCQLLGDQPAPWAQP